MGAPERLRRGGLAVLAGCLVASSLPPLGAWPLGIAGVAVLIGLLAGQGAPARLATGLLAGIGQLAIGLAWAEQFTLPGYLVLVLVESAFLAGAAAVVPRGAGRVPAFAGAVVLAEAARDSFPFGGLPLGSAALGQVGGPLAALARLGGPLAVLGGLALAGAALAEATSSLRSQARPRGRLARLGRPAGTNRGAPAGLDDAADLGDAAGLGAPAGLDDAAERCAPERCGQPERAGPLDRGEQPAWAAPARRAGAAAGVLAVLCCLAAVAPGGGAAIGLLAAAAVQGGRLSAPSDVPAPVEVLAAQLSATGRITGHAGLVLWPEDTVALDLAYARSPEARLLAAAARHLRTTLVVGVTEPAGPGRFRNEVVAIGPSGRVAAVFEKVHLVPFGEYVPDRGLFSHLAGFGAVPSDAVAGHGSGEIATPAGRFAVLVSFETFFAGRARSGVRAGGEALLVPTNTASYATSQVPAQELAASRLEAIAEGRDLLQAATVGYSALVAPDGTVLAELALGKQAVLSVRLPLRRGETPYGRFGQVPVLVLAALTLAAGWALALSARRRPLPRGSAGTDGAKARR
jgi:apolipoprotein N-acyltransferase